MDSRQGPKQNWLRALIVEDCEDDCELLLLEIRRGGFEVDYRRVDSLVMMLAALDEKEWDIVISDYNLPEFSGLAALQALRKKRINLPFILISGSVGEERAIEALKAGAQDYVTKDNLSRLVPAIRREVKESKERAALARALEEAEQKYMQAQKMEAVGQLAGGIAHDFNNILAAIILYTDQILEDAPPDSPSRRYATQVKQAADRGAALVMQLLAFAKKQIFEPRMLNPNLVTSGVLAMLERLLGENITLSTTLAPAIPSIKTDQQQLEQVLLNLVVNARDAMPNGGSISICTRKEIVTDLPGRKPGSYVVLEVTDTGCGMDAATQAHIFEPFFTTKGVAGTGLGLSTVHGIVERSGGFIEVHSKPGQGTRFSVYFPAFDGPGYLPEPDLGPEALAPSQEITVLLVEDDDSVRAALLESLEKQGYQVIHACHANDALAKAGNWEGPIDLLLTDILMPGMNGLELARLVEKSRPEIRTLFMSGHATQHALLESIQEERARFIFKPFTTAEISRKIQEILRHR